MSKTTSKRRTPQEIRDDAKAKYETLVYKARASRLKGPSNKYDAVDTNNTEKRRKATIEMCNEDVLLRPYDRLKMINLCRDLERNSTSAKSILRQFKINVVGTQGKLQLNTDDEEANKEVNDWFNKNYAPNCDSRGDSHFSELLQLDIASIIREGDFLLAVDTFDRMDGKQIRWEADQLVQINEADWKNQDVWTEEVVEDGKKKTIPLKQSSGVIYDSRGRVRAYAVSSKRGLTAVKLTEATILPKGVATLVKNPFRHNQLRGTGDFFAAISDIEDIYEMRAKELQSAKKAATTAAVVTKEDAVDEAIFRGGVGPESLLETADGTAESTTEVVNYESLETLTGGMTEYILPGEDVKILDSQSRPNIHVQEFFDFVLQSSGAGLGLAKAYSKMEAYNSYTAFRGEMVMTWQTFYDWQKFMERHICDWVAVRVIRWAMNNGKISALPKGWEQQISWVFPVMPQVDPMKDNQARREAMKDGFVSFADILGPDWKKKLDAVAEGIQYAKELDIPLSVFESKSGMPLTAYDKKSDGSPNVTEEDVEKNQEMLDTDTDTDSEGDNNGE